MTGHWLCLFAGALFGALMLVAGMFLGRVADSIPEDR